MHIVIFIIIIVIIMVVFCGLPGPQDKDDSAGSGSWILFSQHMGISAHAHYIHRNNNFY